jgi:recombining binding protein suppressor of hairless
MESTIRQSPNADQNSLMYLDRPLPVVTASSPRPLSSESHSWEGAEISSLPSLGTNPSSEPRMSLDYSAAGPHAPSGLYGQPDLDNAPNSMRHSEALASSPPLRRGAGNLHAHHQEGLDLPEHSNYDLFTTSSGQNGSFTSQRYRNGASSSSSLGHNYGLNTDGGYPHPSYGDSVPSFGSPGSSPYDVVHSSLPSSSYSSSRVSPLTPNETIVGLPHSFSQTFGSSKEYPPQPYPELLPDRRMTYQGEMQDEYSAHSLNNGLPFQPPTPTHFQDRLPRFQNSTRFPQSSGTAGTAHLQHGHGHAADQLRGVTPQATHTYRPEGGVTGYGDLSQYLSPNPHAELSLRMPTSVDETLSRMKLHGPTSAMGASSDLQSFIRSVSIMNSLKFSS